MTVKSEATFNHPKVTIIGKLRQKDLGNPRAAAALDEGDPTICWLGTMLGVASNVKRFVDAGDETKVSYALTGTFEGQPANRRGYSESNPDGKEIPVTDKNWRPVLKSGICWLPGGIHELIVEAVTNGDPMGKGPRNVVPFRVKIGTRRAQNAAGYEYVNEIESEITSGADPLAALRQIAGPAEPVAQDPIDAEVEAATQEAATETAVDAESEETAGERADAEDAETRRGSRRRR